MPKIDRKLISRKADIVSDLKKIIKTENKNLCFKIQI